jgi:hypothetical protein
MHTKSPLQANNRSFYDGHESQCQAESKRQPEGCMDEIGRLPNPLNNDDERDHDVAHDKNGEIGWRIIGALVMQGFPAMGARIVYLHEFME